VEVAQAPAEDVAASTTQAVVLLPASTAEVVHASAELKPAVPAAAPKSQPPVLLLSDAVAAALAYSPGLGAMQWQAVAQWEQAQSVLGFGGLATEFSILGMQTDSPLGVFASRLSQGRVTQADFNPATLNNPDLLGNVEYKLKLMYPLFTSGRITLLAEALQLNGEAIDFDRLKMQHELTSKVIETYFAHDLLVQQIVVLDDAQVTVDELKRLIESLEREGLVVKADLAAAEVEVANVSDELNQAQANLALTENVIAVLTGAPAGAFTSVITFEPESLQIRSLEEMTQAALDNRPDLRAMEKRVCAATNVLDEAIRKRNPTLGAFAEGKHASPGILGQGHTEATLGAQLTLDLDTGGVIKHEIEQKRANLEAANLGYQQLLDMAKLDVMQSYSDVIKAQGSMQTFKAQGAKAAENLRVVRNRYREGLTNYLDVRMAATTLKESRLRELNSRYSLLLAYMRMMAATGQIGGPQDPLLNAPSADSAPELQPESNTDSATLSAPGGISNAG
jgi:outer membrane protein